MRDFASILNTRRKAILVITGLLWLTAFVLTHLPASGLPEIQTGDTSLHIAGFFGLTGWVMFSLAACGKKRLSRILIALILMASYAAVDEITQPFFGRAADIRDWQNDLVGAAAAIAFCELAFLLLLPKSKAA